MLPFKKILCPTDFSEPSYKALEVAIDLAAHFSAELHLLNVIAPVPPITPGPAPSVGFNVALYQKELQKSAERNLKKVVEEKIPKKISVRSFIEQGIPGDKIAETAEKVKVDLIVIAKHGMTGWRHLIFGSVAEKVLRTASCPVLAVPTPPEKE
jgi:nucleotide-binding universal stress UspA family protein